MIANFENSLNIEIAISSLEQNGIPKNKILAIPLRQIKNDMIFDTINKTDGISNLDLAMILGSMSMTIGTIYGFIFYWGPIIWGLIGLIAGMGIGFLIDIIPKKKKNSRKRAANGSNSVILMVHCNDTEWKNVKKTMEENMALAVGKWDAKVMEGVGLK
jgi:hypothetical protein